MPNVCYTTHLHIFEEAGSIVFKLRIKSIVAVTVSTGIVGLHGIGWQIVFTSLRCKDDRWIVEGEVGHRGLRRNIRGLWVSDRVDQRRRLWLLQR